MTYYLNNLPNNIINTTKSENKQFIKSHEISLKENFGNIKNIKYVKPKIYKTNQNKNNRSESNKSIKKKKINDNKLINTQRTQKVNLTKKNYNNNPILINNKKKTNYLKNYFLNQNIKNKIIKSNSLKKTNKKKNNNSSERIINSITIKLTKLYDKNIPKTRNNSLSKNDINILFSPSLNQNSLKIAEKLEPSFERLTKKKQYQTFSQSFIPEEKIKNMKKLNDSNYKNEENNNNTIKKNKFNKTYSTPIFEQQMEWKARINLKIKNEQLKNELNEIKDCSFTPRISQIKDLKKSNNNYLDYNHDYIIKRRERINSKKKLEDEENIKRIKPLILTMRAYEKNEGWIYPDNNNLYKKDIYQKLKNQNKIQENNKDSFEKIVSGIFS